MGGTRTAVIAALLGLVGSMAAAPALDPTQPADGPPPDAIVTDHWTFEIPNGHRGPLVAAVTFDYGTEPNSCDLQVVLSGTKSSAPVIYWSEQHTADASYTGAFSSSWNQQAHGNVAGQNVDVREQFGEGGIWSVDSHWIGEYTGTDERLFAVQHAESWFREATGYHPPMLIDLQCALPFAVYGQGLGFEMAGFGADTMDGGTSVSAVQLLAEATYVDGDRWSGSVDDERNEFRLKTGYSNSHVQGELRMEGAGLDMVHPLDGDDDLTLALEPGTLNLELDRIAAGMYDRFYGLVFSYHDVEDLTEAYAAR